MNLVPLSDVVDLFVDRKMSSRVVAHNGEMYVLEYDAKGNVRWRSLGFTSSRWDDDNLWLILLQPEANQCLIGVV